MSRDNSIEREFKFACQNLSALREQLVESDAERISASTKEENWVLDRPTGQRGAEGNCERLVDQGKLLRVRSSGAESRLTFKGPAHFEEGAKIRTELEVETGDHETVLGILENLGFEIVRKYEKYRETWRLGGVEICLDHTPIGDFVEFEGTGCEKIATRFGFVPENAEPNNYLELYQGYRDEHPEAPEDMVFM